MSNLKEAVLTQLGFDDLDDIDTGTLQDICNHGADSGFVGFTYYDDTVEFFNNNKSDIISMAKEQADEFGVDYIEMIKSFNCISDDIDVAAGLYEADHDDETTVKNAMSWFALEEIARLMVD